MVFKSTGHEKARVSVCLTARADGQKTIHCIRKRDVLKLNEEFRGKCIVASSENGWMNTPLTIDWVQKVLGALSFNKRFMVWDSFECHITESICKDLKAKKI